MNAMNRIIRWFAGVPQTPLYESDDFNKLDQSVARMVAAHGDFAIMVNHVVKDLDIERRARRAHAKAISRSHKT
jgi:hypothetical protein